MDSFSDFFATTTGTVTVAAIMAITILFFIFNLRRMKALSVKALTYSAFCITLATLLSYVKLFDMPQGGTVTACSMFFISIVGYFFGLQAGILAGITYGLLQLILDPYVVHPIQLLFDYILAFGMIGLSGLFCKQKYGLQIGFVVGCLGRFLMSAISGYVFFAAYVPEGQNPVLYTVIYNISYIAPEIFLTLIIISIPAVRTSIERLKNSIAMNDVAVV